MDDEVYVNLTSLKDSPVEERLALIAKINVTWIELTNIMTAPYSVRKAESQPKLTRRSFMYRFLSAPFKHEKEHQKVEAAYKNADALMDLLHNLPKKMTRLVINSRQLSTLDKSFWPVFIEALANSAIYTINFYDDSYFIERPQLHQQLLSVLAKNRLKSSGNDGEAGLMQLKLQCALNIIKDSEHTLDDSEKYLPPEVKGEYFQTIQQTMLLPELRPFQSVTDLVQKSEGNLDAVLVPLCS